jgi:hypothetical protein
MKYAILFPPLFLFGFDLHPAFGAVKMKPVFPAGIGKIKRLFKRINRSFRTAAEFILDAVFTRH